MRLTLVLCVLCLAACSDGKDAVTDGGPALLPFQSYPQMSESRGASCDNPVDVDAPVITSGHGFDLANTRRAESIIDASNVADLQLNFTYASEGVTEMRGAAAVTAQAIFFTAGDALMAVNRLTGCLYWAYQHPQPGTVFRSTSVLLAQDAVGGAVVYLGDYNGSVHAVDMRDGAARWQTFAGTDPQNHFITGGMQYHDGTLIVPVSSKEVVVGAFQPGGCCTSHGMVVALNGADGAKRWEYHTTAEATTIIQPGERLGPNGAPVWSTPTIDAARNAVHFGTGQNYTEPTTGTSDAIISLDLADGSVNWIYQATSGDAWNYACQFMLPLRCPEPEGHDFDFGAAPILVDDGSALIAGDKGGMVYSIDADSGALNWAQRVSIGSKLGGVHWGMAIDTTRVFVAATDFEIDPASGALQDLKPGADPGIYALDQTSGELLWEIHPVRQFEGLDTPYLFSASVAVTNDVLFAGSLDGVMKAFATYDGTELWTYDVDQALSDINGVMGNGGTIDGAGFVVAGDGLLVNSGYTEIFGGVGRYQAGEGNSLFVFALPQQR